MQNHPGQSADTANQNQAAGPLPEVRIGSMAHQELTNKGWPKMTINPTKQNIINIAERLCENVAKIRYGSVSAILKIHDGRVVDVTHSITENTRDQEKYK